MGKVFINIYPPFSDVLRKRQIQISIENYPITFQDLMKQLTALYPELNEVFSENINGENLYGVSFPVRQGKLLSLEDVIDPGDIIELYGSLHGG